MFTRLDGAEERIRTLKDKSFEIIQLKIKNEKDWRKPKGTIGHKQNNMQTLGVPEREKNRAQCLSLEIVVGNLPNLWREMGHWISEAPQNIPEKTNSKKSTQTHYNHIFKI